MLFQVTRSPRAPARRPPASPPRRGEPDNSGSGGITCVIAVRSARRNDGCSPPSPVSLSCSWRRLLGGTPPGIGLRPRSALRRDRGREGRDGSVSNPSDRRDAATFTSRWSGCAGPARAAAGVQPADASGRRHSEHRAALRPRPATPQAALRGVARWHSACSPFHVQPTSSFCCRSRRIGSGADEFGGASRGSPVSREPGNDAWDK